MAQESSLTTLAETIQREAEAIASFSVSSSHAAPSLNQDWPEKLPQDIEASRQRLQEAAKAIYDIASGPQYHIHYLAWNYHNAAALRWILHFKIPQAIPLEGTASYTQIAATCSVPETLLRRILRFCMTNRLFNEPSPNQVSHTTYSAYLLKNENFTLGLEYMGEETFQASTKWIEAQKKWPDAQAPNHSAFSLAWDTDLPLYEFVSQPGNEERARRFVGILAHMQADPSHDLRHVINGYLWEDVDSVVDIGGGSGEVAVALTRVFPHLEVVVEDLQYAVAAGKDRVPEDVKERIGFVEHDFFKPQPEAMKGKKTFFMRMILHNWSDSFAARIIEALLPSLKSGARLLVMEMMMPEPGTLSETVERQMRQMDLEMMQSFNAVERSAEEWKALFASVDSDLVMKSACRPEGSVFTIMEFGFKES